MKRIKYVLIVLCLLLVGCDFGYSNNNNNIDNEKKYDDNNKIKSIVLTVDKNKTIVNENIELKAIVGEGIWLMTGSKTERENLKIFYYTKEKVGEGVYLGESEIGSSITIQWEEMEEIDVYCILAHKNYRSSSKETECLMSNVVNIVITGNIISTAEQLQNIQKNGMYFLENDIDLSDVEFQVIPEFNGTLDGQGHSIKNLKIKAKQDYIGLFGKCNGTIKNLNLENIDIIVPESAKEFKYVGGITGYSESGYFENIKVSGTIEANKTSYVGGVAGYIYSSKYNFYNLKNEANITGASYVGGIFGYCNVSEINNFINEGNIYGTGNWIGGLAGKLNCSTIEDCDNTGSIEGNLYVGGISGEGYGSVYNLKNKSSIKGTAYVGCLFGSFYGTMDKCANEGSTLEATGYDDVETKNAYVGGYTGRAQSEKITNCINTVDINYTSNGNFVGGIAGYIFVSQNAKVENLKNEASINGASYVGGIYGYCSGYYTYNYGYGKAYNNIEVVNLLNEGNIKGTSNFVGGLFGFLTCKSGSSLEETKNTGDIEGNLYVGGISGYVGEISYYEDNENVGAIVTAYNVSNSSAVKGNAYVGCLFGIFSGNIEKCSNEGSSLYASGYDSVDTKNAYVGGFVGYGFSFTASNCTNKVDINYTSDGKYVGGIAGYVIVKENSKISNLKNEANIIGSSYVGGIYGWYKGYYYRFSGGYGLAQSNLELNNLSNEGSVIGTEDYIGGLFGSISCSILMIKDSSNSSFVSGKKYVGGIIGYLSCSSNSEASNLSSIGEVKGAEEYDSYFGYGTLTFK